MVAAAAMVAAPPAGVMAPAEGMAVRTWLRRARAAIAAGAIAPAGGAATIAAATAAAGTKPDFSDGNFGPDLTDGNLGPNGVAQNASDRLHSNAFQNASDMLLEVWPMRLKQ